MRDKLVNDIIKEMMSSDAKMREDFEFALWFGRAHPNPGRSRSYAPPTSR